MGEEISETALEVHGTAELYKNDFRWAPAKEKEEGMNCR